MSTPAEARRLPTAPNGGMTVQPSRAATVALVASTAFAFLVTIIGLVALGVVVFVVAALNSYGSNK